MYRMGVLESRVHTRDGRNWKCRMSRVMEDLLFFEIMSPSYVTASRFISTQPKPGGTYPALEEIEMALR